MVKSHLCFETESSNMFGPFSGFNSPRLVMPTESLALSLNSCKHSTFGSVDKSESEGTISKLSKNGMSKQATTTTTTMPRKKSDEIISSEFAFLPQMDRFALDCMKINESNLKLLKDQNSPWPAIFSHSLYQKQFAGSEDSRVLSKFGDELKVDHRCNEMQSHRDEAAKTIPHSNRSHKHESADRKFGHLFTAVPSTKLNKATWNTLSQCNKTSLPFLHPPFVYPFSLHSPLASPFTANDAKNNNFLFADQPAVFPPWWKFENIMLANHILNKQYFQALTRCNTLHANPTTLPSHIRKYHTLKKQTFGGKNFRSKTDEKTMSQRPSESTLLQDVRVPANCNINFRRGVGEQPPFPNNPSLSSNNGNGNFWHGNFSFERDFMELQQGSKLSCINDSIFHRKMEKEKIERDDHLSSPSVVSLPTETDLLTSPLPIFQNVNIPEVCNTSIGIQKHPISSHNFKIVNNKSLPAHLNTLKEKRSHRCFYCGKLYSRKYGLKIHIRTHTGYKPLKCKICGRPFGDPSNLNKHVRLHAEGETPYRCQFCGKVLVRRRDLERHINSRHPEKKTPFVIGDQLKCPPADPRLWSAKQ